MNWKKLASTGFCAGAFAAVAVGGWFWWQSLAANEPKAPVAKVPRPVKAIQAGSNVPTRSRVFPGVARESQATRLAFRVSGPLCEMNVNLGQRVKKGDVIARIDPRDFDLAVARIEAGLAEAHAGLKAMRRGARDEDLRALSARLAGGEAKLHEAELHFNRFQALYADQSVSKAQYDNARTMLDVARAEVTAIRQELEKAQRGAREEEIEAMEAKIAGLEAGLTTARNARQDTVLVAPFTGYVAQKFVENYDTVAAGHPVVALLDCSQIEVAIGVPEEVVLQERRFRGFECEFDAYPGRRFPATLKEIGHSIQSGKQTYPLSVIVTPPEDVALRPGMAATVRINIAQPAAACCYPAAAVVVDQGGAYVWVVDPASSTVHRRPVKAGQLAAGGIEILDGIQPGQWVVVAGAHFLHEGQRIRLDRSGQAVQGARP